MNTPADAQHGWHPREEDELELLRLELDECVKEIKRLRAALAEAESSNLDAYREMAGPPGGTCTRAEAMSDAEWVRRHWRNAIDQWEWWKAEADRRGEPQPVTLVIRAQNWEARARAAEAALADGGRAYEAAVVGVGCECSERGSCYSEAGHCDCLLCKAIDAVQAVRWLRP